MALVKKVVSDQTYEENNISSQRPRLSTLETIRTSYITARSVSHWSKLKCAAAAVSYTLADKVYSLYERSQFERNMDS